MSTTSIRHQRVYATLRGDPGPASVGDRTAARAPGEAHPPAGWRRQALEIGALLAVIVIGQRRAPDGADIPGLPHPYWLPVLLASSQYGVAGGMIAAVAASAVYLLELSPQSAAQDFFAYARGAALQPAMWMATALVLGGLRSLHMHQQAEVAEQLAASRRRSADLGDGLELAVSEIAALERRIAEDATSVAALTRALAEVDLGDRRAAAASFGELFRLAAGVGDLVVYLREPGGYAPALAVEHGVARPTGATPTLSDADMEALAAQSAGPATKGAPHAARRIVFAPPEAGGPDRLAAFVCDLEPAQDERAFRRRAEDLARCFAAVLRALPDLLPEDRP